MGDEYLDEYDSFMQEYGGDIDRYDTLPIDWAAISNANADAANAAAPDMGGRADESGTTDRSYDVTGGAGQTPMGQQGNMASGGLLDSIKSGASGVGSFIKENPGLSQSLLAGLAGMHKDQNAKELASMQIDYLKQKQKDLNASITPYGKTIAAPRN